MAHAWHVRFAIPAAAAACLWAAPAPALTLVDNGRSSATIYVKAGEPGPDPHFYGAGPKAASLADVAGELSDVLEKMSGAKVPVSAVASAKQIPAGAAIVLGSLAGELGLEVPRPSAARDGFRYRVTGGRLLIAGESAAGVYHGVYDFLESLGCGWYTPGAVGEVIPRRPTVTVPDDLDHAEASDSIHREYWGDGQWAFRNKGWRRIGTWRHAWGHLVPKELFQKDPDLFALNDGHRRTRQLCTTNPRAIRVAADALLKMMADQPYRVVFEAGPNDGGDFKLHAPYRTVLEGKVRRGKLVELRVTPEEPRKDVIVGQ